MVTEKTKLGAWRVHTPNLLEEITKNEGVGILKIPLNIFRLLLVQVAERALIINDKELNKLMLRLSLYDVSIEEEINNSKEKFITDYIES